jgi:glycosyltransferase involved in cell wall biosynthesis
MSSPDLNELPPPPPGKTGWPWDEGSPKNKDNDLVMDPCPTISVVTTSFNQGKFVEETIRSVLLQGYPNLEYIIIDGGSTDGSVEIINQYATWLSYWESVPDRGQAHALNKGFARSSGDLLGWLNSDDVLSPQVIDTLAREYLENPNAILVGDVIMFSETTDFLQVWDQKNVTFHNMVQNWNSGFRWSQPGTFVPRSQFQKVAGFDESLRYLFDRDWMCRLLQIAPVKYLKVPVAEFRLHKDSKTVAEAPAWLKEQILVTERYGHQVAGFDTRLARAKMEVWHGALPYLSLTRYKVDKKQGLSHLIKSLHYDWRVFFWVKFIILLLVVLTPLRLYNSVRRYIKL